MSGGLADKVMATIVGLGTLSLVSVIVADVYTEFKLTKVLAPVALSLAALVFITVAIGMMKTVWGG
jgi:hypothetical protein